MDKSLLNKNTVLEIVDMNDSGQGIAKKEGMVYFVNGAVIGDFVKAKIVLIKKNYAVADALKIISPSIMRKNEYKDSLYVPYGLSLRPLQYEHQLEYKENDVYKTIEKIANVEIKKKNKIIALDSEERYRNKGVFPIRNISGEIKIGAFERGSHDIVEILDNPAMPKSYSIVLSEIKTLIQKYNISAYTESSHSGALKFLTLRSNYLGEHLIILNFKDDELKEKNCEKVFVDELKSNLELKNIKVAGIIKSIKKEKSNSPIAGKLTTLYGNNYITKKIDKVVFKLGVESFFQVSTEGVEKLYAEILRITKNIIDEKNYGNCIEIWDIYCGVGSISIYLAKMLGENDIEFRIKGLEFVEEAINYAKENANLNDIKDSFFESGRAEVLMPNWVDKYNKPDLIIVDPPRKGLDKRVIESVIKTDVENIIYVSCKVSTLARDISLFNEAGYELIECTPTDIFPMSMHCEVIALLNRKLTV